MSLILLALSIALADPHQRPSLNMVSNAVTSARLGETSAGSANDKAVYLYKRLVGATPAPNDPLLVRMTQSIAAGRMLEAAQAATTHDNFFKITFYYMAAKMSNRSELPSVPLNDFIATMIGCAREGLASGQECDARTLLTGNYRYTRDYGRAGITAPLRIEQQTLFEIAPGGPYGDVYRDWYNEGFNLGELVRRPAQAWLRLKSCSDTRFDCADSVAIPQKDSSSLLTTRQWGSEFLLAGTNRRAVEFTFREFLCAPVEAWADITNSDAKIGADVTRQPAGGNATFQTTCRGCHSGLDALRPAFARHDFNGALMVKDSSPASDFPGANFVFPYNPSYPNVAYKYNKNPIPENTYRVLNDSWENLTVAPTKTAYFGWKGNFSGNGLNAFAQMVVNSDRFPKCMAQRAFREVCKRNASADDVAMLDWAAIQFQNDNYNLRNLFARIAIQKECAGN